MWIYALASVMLMGGITLFGIGIGNSDTKFTAPGICAFGVGFVLSVILLAKHLRKRKNATETVAMNPVMKKNKSDTNLELMSEIQESTNRESCKQSRLGCAEL